MAGVDAAFSGSIPDIYERNLGPLLFVPYAEDIAQRARVLGGRDLLEIAAGTGIVTRELARLFPDASIHATDLNEAMAKCGAALSASAGVKWSVADAMNLPFEAAQFDLAICQFGVMFFPDRVQAFREVRRVLRHGGAYLFNAWDGLAFNDVARYVAEAAEGAFPENPPQFLRRTPYGHGDPVAIERDLRAAGFHEVAWERVERRSRASSPRSPAVGFCEGSPLRHEILERDPERLAGIVEAAAQALQTAYGDTVDGAMRAMVFTAR